jgi:hypothetical protein
VSSKPETESTAVAPFPSKLHRAIGAGGSAPEKQANGIKKPKAAGAKIVRTDWIIAHPNVNVLIVLDTPHLGKGEKEPHRAPKIRASPSKNFKNPSS